MNVRVKFLEAFSNSCETSSLPYADRNYLFQEIAFLSDRDLTNWIQSIDDSLYSLEEWLLTLLYFQKWLQENHKGKNFTDQIEYIHCGIQGNSNNGRLLTLLDLTKSYLDSFGVQ